MFQTLIRLSPWSAVLATAFLVAPAHAQFNGGSGAANPMAYGGYGPNYGYGANPGYGYTRQTPYQGYMNGAANITTANAQYQMTIQQAKQEQEKARRSALTTHRATIEERQYEQSLQPNPEEIRQKELQFNLQRARNNPPSSEIWSGTALDDLLAAIKDGQSHGLAGPEVPLSPDVVRHINLTTGTTYGGVGVLRDDGKLTWPAVLRKTDFDKGRQTINEQMQQAVTQARGGEVDATLLDGIGGSLKDLQAEIDAQVQVLSPTQYVQASRYVRELKSSYQVLQRSDVAKYFQPKWTAQGATVAELVRQMTQQGLHFGPATSGDEPYYTSLHRSLVDYDIGIAQLSGGVAHR